MPSSTNPYKPDERPTHEHVKAIVSEALQDWIQRKKIPYEVEGLRGPIELTMEDMYIIQGSVRASLDVNAKAINNTLERGIIK